MIFAGIAEIIITAEAERQKLVGERERLLTVVGEGEPSPDESIENNDSSDEWTIEKEFAEKAWERIDSTNHNNLKE